MILALWPPPIFPSPAKFSRDFSKPPYLSSNTVLGSSIFSSKFSGKDAFKCSCTEKEKADGVFEDFSVLSTDIPWDSEGIWSTMALYFFSLHIPLSFGGLSVVTEIMHQPVLDPQTQATSLFLIQILELLGTLVLLKYTAKPQYNLVSFFEGDKFSKERNWVLASALGFGFLILLVLLTSVLADRLVGPKVVNNPVLKEILSSGSISRTTCFLIYCLVTPLLEETVYRGFLLRSLAATMKWQQAVITYALILIAPSVYSSVVRKQGFITSLILPLENKL